MGEVMHAAFSLGSLAYWIPSFFLFLFLLFFLFLFLFLIIKIVFSFWFRWFSLLLLLLSLLSVLLPRLLSLPLLLPILVSLQRQQLLVLLPLLLPLRLFLGRFSFSCPLLYLPSSYLARQLAHQPAAATTKKPLQTLRYKQFCRCWVLPRRVHARMI